MGENFLLCVCECVLSTSLDKKALHLMLLVLIRIDKRYIFSQYLFRFGFDASSIFYQVPTSIECPTDTQEHLFRSFVHQSTHTHNVLRFTVLNSKIYKVDCEGGEGRKLMENGCGVNPSDGRS